MTSTLSSNDLEVLRNRTFDEIAVGDCASIERGGARRIAQAVAAGWSCRSALGVGGRSVSAKGRPEREQAPKRAARRVIQ